MGCGRLAVLDNPLRPPTVGTQPLDEFCSPKRVSISGTGGFESDEDREVWSILVIEERRRRREGCSAETVRLDRIDDEEVSGGRDGSTPESVGWRWVEV